MRFVKRNGRWQCWFGLFERFRVEKDVILLLCHQTTRFLCQVYNKRVNGRCAWTGLTGITFSHQVDKYRSLYIHIVQLGFAWRWQAAKVLANTHWLSSVFARLFPSCPSAHRSVCYRAIGNPIWRGDAAARIYWDCVRRLCRFLLIHNSYLHYIAYTD